MDKECILKKTFPGSDKKYKDSRIYFSEFDMSGLDDFHEYSSNSDFFKYLEFGAHTSKKDSINYIIKVRNRILNGYQGGHTMYWFIRLRHSQKVIGSLALFGVDFNKKVGWIGKGLSPLYWGKGYMSEAMDIYLSFCKNILGLKEINSYTRHDNVPNIKLMKKHGFRSVKELESYYRDANGDFHNAVQLSIRL